MTTPTPDVREIAEEAFYAGFAASGHRYDLSHDEEHELRVTAGVAAVLSAVTPVIRQQERDRVAFEIDAFAKNLEMNSAEGDWEEALNALKDAAAVSRSHVQHRTEAS